MKLMVTPPTPSKSNFGPETESKLDGLEFHHCENVMEDDDESTESSISESAFKRHTFSDEKV